MNFLFLQSDFDDFFLTFFPGCTLLTVLEPTEVEFTLFQEGQRNSERSQRSQLDLCVVIFRTSSDGSSPQLGKVIEHSKRQVRGFVGCHAMLEPGCYLVVCLAFNHWQSTELSWRNLLFKFVQIMWSVEDGSADVLNGDEVETLCGLKLNILPFQSQM